MEKAQQLIQVKLPEKGILNLSKIKSIKRKGKNNIFSQKLKGNVTKYLYDFLFYEELLTICPTNVFLLNCLSEYEMSSWDIEIRNIIDIFNLNVKNIKDEVGDSLASCIAKNRLYKISGYDGNYIKINNEGINIISSVFYDPDMKLQLNKLNNNINNGNLNINLNNSLSSFDSFNLIENDEEMDKINPYTLKTPWKVIPCNNSYNKGNIIFLEDKSPLDFGFSFNNVIKGNYKFYLHQHITNMKNAKLIMKITINNILVYETKDFPNSKILEQFNNNATNNSFDDLMSDEEEENNKQINLKETFICDIKEEMFDKIRNNSKKTYESKNTTDSIGSTESATSKNSNKNSDKNSNTKIQKYTIRVSFTNQHLFWKAGWYLDGGKLVKDMGKI
jgi:hypothetical protein